jgi:hypothetical protein
MIQIKKIIKKLTNCIKQKIYTVMNIVTPINVQLCIKWTNRWLFSTKQKSIIFIIKLKKLFIFLILYIKNQYVCFKKLTFKQKLFCILVLIFLIFLGFFSLKLLLYKIFNVIYSMPKRRNTRQTYQQNYNQTYQQHSNKQNLYNNIDPLNKNSSGWDIFIHGYDYTENEKEKKERITQNKLDFKLYYKKYLMNQYNLNLEESEKFFIFFNKENPEFDYSVNVKHYFENNLNFDFGGIEVQCFINTYLKKIYYKQSIKSNYFSIAQMLYGDFFNLYSKPSFKKGESYKEWKNRYRTWDYYKKTLNKKTILLFFHKCFFFLINIIYILKNKKIDDLLKVYNNGFNPLSFDSFKLKFSYCSVVVNSIIKNFYKVSKISKVKKDFYRDFNDQNVNSNFNYFVNMHCDKHKTNQILIILDFLNNLNNIEQKKILNKLFHEEIINTVFIKDNLYNISNSSISFMDPFSFLIDLITNKIFSNNNLDNMDGIGFNSFDDLLVNSYSIKIDQKHINMELDLKLKFEKLPDLAKELD